MATMIHFPNEILSLIINALTPDEKAALASCRLACHTLCSLATPLLFSSIQLIEADVIYTSPAYDSAGIPIRAVKLNQILMNNDYIGISVRTLVLRYRNNNDGLTGGGIIASILPRLPHIQYFTLDVLESYCSLKFPSIAQDLSSAIQAVFRSRHLTGLDLCNIWDFPLVLITQSTNLQHLRLSKMDFSENVHDTATIEDSHLKSFEIDEDSLIPFSKCIEENQSFQKYFSPIENLQIVALNGPPISMNMIWDYGWDIVRVTSQHLTTLLIQTGPYIISSSFLEDCPYNLNWFPSLEHFEIELRVLFPVNNTLLVFLNQFLSVQSSSTSLVETLYFKLGWICDEPVGPGHTEDLFSPDAGWAALDKTLTSDKFVSLRRVVFKMWINFEERDSIDDWEHFYRELELAKRLTRPFLDALLPMTRGLSNRQGQERTLEIYFSFVE